MTQQQPQPTLSRRRMMQLSGATLTAIGGVGLAQTTSASTSNQGVLADGLADGIDRRAFIGGMLGGYSSSFGTPEPVDVLADRARNEFNANADAWVDYGNWLLEEADVRALGSAEIGVEFLIRRRYSLRRAGSLETTIIADFDDDNDEFSDLEWLAESPEDADFEVQLRDKAAVNAADELSEYRREWIDDGHELPDDAYLSDLSGRYALDIGFGDESKNVLELLLGEVDL